MEYQVIENQPIARRVWRMVLQGNTECIRRPGQFVQLALPGYYLRRPISVCDWTEDTLTLVYKELGEGTRSMAGYPAGMKLDVLPGLGNGFDVEQSGEHPLLVGGGVGLPPLFALARHLMAAGKMPQLAVGFNCQEDAFLLEEFRQLGLTVSVATMDGSIGTKGLVTDVIRGLPFDSLYACGPLPMLRVVYDVTEGPAQFSFEERMGCGFGACMGCSVRTKTGSKRICKEGPVLRREEILWNGI